MPLSGNMHVRDRQTITLFTQNTCKKLGIEHGKQLTLEFKAINLKFKNMSIFLIIKLCLKLRWFGHVSRSSGLAKTILQGTVKGKRKRGRQKKRWEDNIKEGTGMDFASSTRAAENRSRWKGIVANSSVVP